MGYKAVINDSSYLCHFNKNHDPKNGRFTFAKIGDVVKGVAADVGRGFKGGAKVVVKGVSDSGVGDKLKKVGGGLKSVGSEVGRGFKNATNTIKKELNDPSSADFNGDKVSISTEEKIPESFKPPESFKTPELNEKNKIVEPVVDKLNNITKLPWLFNEGIASGDYKSNAIQKWGKEYVDAADIGLKACKELNLRDAYGSEITNLDRSWFVLEDQTFGMAQVAYLASIGKTNKEINSIISANNDLEKANTDYTSQAKTYEEYLKIADTEPYKTNWYLYSSSYQGDDATSDEYINKCIEIANESKVRHSIVVNCGNYLVHYNKNHSKTNGQFISGDGDSDGVVDDHHNYKKNKVTVNTKSSSGTYKSYDDGKEKKYKQTITTIEKKTGNTKIVDDLVEKSEEKVRQEFGIPKNVKLKPSEIGNFGGANRLFDSINNNAVEIYEKTGDVKKATDYIINNMADVPYKIILRQNDLITEGRKEVDFILETYGDKYMYGSQGDSDQSDEEYFWYNDKK